MHKIQGDYFTRIVKIDGVFLNPSKSQKIKNHSPDGFMWGYYGSGPAQLALSIMLEYVDKHVALLIYQYFKTDFVATLPDTSFEIKFDIEGWINKKVWSLKIPGDSNKIYDHSK